MPGKNVKRIYQTYPMAVIGIGLAILYWLLEGVVMTIWFHEGGFVSQLFSPDPHEIWMRSAVVGALAAFSIYGQFIINRRKKVEKRLEEACEKETGLRSDLEAEVTKRGEFTRVLVHELQTPVTSILASSELLTLELPEGALLQLANIVNRGASNLNRQIGELLDLARGETGALELTVTSMEPLPLSQAVLDELVPVAARRGQRLTADLPSHLSQIVADQDRLRQVILNLLNNAFKYTPEGGSVILRAGEEDGGLVVEIEDTGSGIPQEYQDRIFDLFYRVPDAKGRAAGSGIGLALCKKLVELHGGHIWVKSREGGGSTFGFSVPLATASETKELV